MNDADYYTALVAWVRVLLSSGTINNLITIFSLMGVPSPVVLTEYFPAAFIIETIGAVLTAATLTNAAAFLHAAKGGGIYGFLHYSPVPTASTFTLGTVAQYAASPLGFNSGYFSGIVGG